MITENQFGYKTEKSRVPNLSVFLLKGVKTSYRRGTVYLDLKKTFDKVPHRRLIWMMESVRKLRGRILHWMGDFLKDRMIRTIIRDRKSTSKHAIHHKLRS